MSINTSEIQRFSKDLASFEISELDLLYKKKPRIMPLVKFHIKNEDISKYYENQLKIQTKVKKIFHDQELKEDNSCYKTSKLSKINSFERSQNKLKRNNFYHKIKVSCKSNINLPPIKKKYENVPEVSFKCASLLELLSPYSLKSIDLRRNKNKLIGLKSAKYIKMKSQELKNESIDSPDYLSS
ncbi:unnamed protein product [Blepharisma stoltei]|uniref:Uncharacterized protein n=1 Tax=Blepharisma stoltei TaxID=1481888 RepID=A0AAU9JFK7_9CILI|nr:unnamed protein product [Blepharisma stoltei]